MTRGLVAAFAALVGVLSQGAALAQPTDLGGGWSAVALRSPYDRPNAIACTDTDAYARTHAGLVVRFDGSLLDPLPRPGLSIPTPYGPGIDVSPAGDVVLTGYGPITTFVGGTWRAPTVPVGYGVGTPLFLDTGRLLLPGDGAIIGVDVAAGTARAYDAGTWRRLFAFDGTASDFWAVGQGGAAVHWTAGSLVATNVGAGVTLDGVRVVGAADVWAWSTGRWHERSPSGVGGAFHWDGATWTERSVATAPVRAVVASGPDVLAVTEHEVFRWTATGWTSVLSQPARTLSSGCATRTHAVLVDEAGALVFRRWP